MFKQASKLKLRFVTDKGLLSVEQLWDLSLVSLANAIKAVKKILVKNDTDDDLSFLNESSVIDTENELRFNILKEVYTSKKKELTEKAELKATKEWNDKIDMLIANKQEEQLLSKSVEELTKLKR